MRRVFGEIINELANKDKKIILVVGDIGYGIFDKFRKISRSLYIFKKIRKNESVKF